MTRTLSTIRPVHRDVLAALEHGPQTIGTLMRIHPSVGFYGILRAMQRRGWVRVERNEDNLPLSRVSLTQLGRRLNRGVR